MRVGFGEAVEGVVAFEAIELEDFLREDVFEEDRAGVVAPCGVGFGLGEGCVAHSGE